MADYSDIIQKAAQTYNVDPALIRGVIGTESTNNPNAVSDKGATGLMQIMPSNYKSLGITNPNDPTQNIMGGTKLLSQLLDRFGDVTTALRHYHGGDNTANWGPVNAAYPAKVFYAGGIMSQPQGNAMGKSQTLPGIPTAQATNNASDDEIFASFSKGAAPAQAASGGQGAQSDDAIFSAFTKQAAPAQQAAAPAAQTPAPAPDSSMPTKPMTPVTAAQNGSTLSDIAQKGVGNFAGSLLDLAGAGARMIGANDFANQAKAAHEQINKQIAAGTNNSTAGKVAGFVGQAAPYATMGGASVPGAVVGGLVGGAAPSIAAGDSASTVLGNAAVGGTLGLGGGLVAKGVGALAAPVSRALGRAADSVIPNVSGRGSVGAAGTPFADQAAAEGVAQPLVQKITAAERAGNINSTAAGRHIEAGSLPVPVELTAGQATGDIHALSNELNSRAKNPVLADRFNAQNGQINDNLTALRDMVSPDVNVPSGAPTGQAIIDAYKEMDAPVRQRISELYAAARGADGAPAMVDAAPQMTQFERDIGPTRFKALPASVQQIFADAKNNAVSLPATFDQTAGSTRPMNVSDLMDIDKTLSGALADVKDGSVRHDIGMLRDRIIGSDLNPSSAGQDAFQAYRDAQAAARTRFQAIDADPAYKAAIGDISRVGEPSSLADDFVRKYVAGGKTANVTNMLQNLSNDPQNAQLVASGLMDHIRAQAGVDLRTGTGNISQSGLNKALTNQGDKLRAVLGPQASQTLETLGNVARYTQEQPRGSYVNNSNTATTLMGHAGNLAKAAAQRGVDTLVPGAQLGSWAREALANRANAQAVNRSLELGAGLRGLDRLR
jgi:hypothetical protein